eukprot:scaffold3.g6169.t1
MRLRQVEEDLGLEKDALKPMKELIAAQVDKIIARQKDRGGADEEEEAAAASSDDEPRGKQGRKESRADKPRKKQRLADATEERQQKPAAAPWQYSRQVEKLRALCKAATITIPPATYVKNKDNASLEQALEALLEKHGLSADAGEKQVAKAKQRLQVARELEGIDTSNIIDGGRRPRAAAQAARANYAAMQRQDGGSSEEEEEEEEDELSSAGTSGSDVGEDEEEQQQSAQFVSADESDGAEQQRRQQPQASPNENHAPSASSDKAKPTIKPAAAALEDSDSEPAGRLGDQDYTTLAAAVEELQAWLPAKCDQVVQVSAATLALGLRTATARTHLYLSWQQHAAGITRDGPPASRGAASEAFGFGEQVQAALRGQGRYSNLVLAAGEEGSIVAAGHQVGGKQSSLRQVQVGGAYELPPPGPGLDPDVHSLVADWQQVVVQQAAQPGKQPGSLSAALVRAFRGVSPALVRELCSAAGVAENAAPGSLTGEQWGALWQQWQHWLERVCSGSFAACCCPNTGRMSVLGIYSQPVESLLELLHSQYSSAKEQGEFAAVRQQLQGGVGAGIQRQLKKLESLWRQGGQEGKHLETSKLADLLMANAHRWHPGMKSMEVEDWDAPEGTLVAVPLEGRSAVDQATKLYKQAGKQRRAVQAVAPLMQQALQVLEFLQEVALQLEQLDGPSDLAALREIQADLVEAGFIKPSREAALVQKAASKAKRAIRRSKEQAGAAAGLRRYITPGGLTVLVGRNSRQNDLLSTKMVQPPDLWFHTRGVPGAHVLLRVPAGQSAADADVQFAADLSAYFSKSRLDTKARAWFTCCCCG